MPITQLQKQQAQTIQEQAAHDTGQAIRTLAGPGTGKSRTIAERVHWLISTIGVSPNDICVISFTRATVRDLRQRIVNHCTQNGSGPQSNIVRISTMHSLALSALRRGNLLGMFPAGPIILDEWEQRNIFDKEFAAYHHCTPGRARKIRQAYDAYWQTLQGSQPNQVTTAEQVSFEAFHAQFTTFYSCIFPGEVVRRCVDNIIAGVLQPDQLSIRHLIVDEFQDLNACDQQFIRSIAAAGATLWVAGDDDQSIYSFRHADATGIQGFGTTYAASSSHTLGDCFRCAPAVRDAAIQLITHNPSPPRIPKPLNALYGAASPPVTGRVCVWRFPNHHIEAREVAESCGRLIAAGLPPSEILVLLSNRRSQLHDMEQACHTAGVAFAAPRGPEVADGPAGRLLFALLRIVEQSDDYAAHRDLLELHQRVGVQTCLDIETSAVAANLNFRSLFYAPLPSGVFNSRAASAIQRVAAVVQHIGGWQILDTVLSHDVSIPQIIDSVFGVGTAAHTTATVEWQQLRGSFPDDMTLEEVLAFLKADSEVGQLQVIHSVQTRLGIQTAATPPASDRIRILTMHGAKGLEGTVVFIPGFEQEMMPGRYALASAGLIQERRRLLYTSVTRAKAYCILTLARNRSGAGAQTLMGAFQYAPAPSQFIAELAVPLQNRSAGLSAADVGGVLIDYSNL